MDESEPTTDRQGVAAAAASAMYAHDHASRALGMRVLEVRPGYARLSMAVRQDMVNGHGICHGGLIFTLADSAFAFACNSYDSVTVAAAATVEFLLPGRLGDELTAVAQERSRARRSGIYDVEVRNQMGDCIALFRGRSHEIGGSLINDPNNAAAPARGGG
jgi:acyl-CoA thioesterase